MGKLRNKPRNLKMVNPANVRTECRAGRHEREVTELHFGSPSPAAMIPGDVVFLDDVGYVRDDCTANFVAVLACPRCGVPGLITSGQYFRGAPIACTSRECPGVFRIVDETRIVSLPVC